MPVARFLKPEKPINFDEAMRRAVRVPTPGSAILQCASASAPEGVTATFSDYSGNVRRPAQQLRENQTGRSA